MRLNFRDLGAGLFGAVIAWIVIIVFGPKAVIGDPPIIVHGGSVHMIVANSGDGLSNQMVSVGVKNNAAFNVGAYKLSSGSGISSPFKSNWEVDVCNFTNQAPDCTHGLKICSSRDTSNSNNCLTSGDLPTGSLISITVTSLDAAGGSTDRIAKGEIPPQFSSEYRYKLSPATAYHPGQLKITQGTATSTYDCAPATQADAVTFDWTACWASFGKN